MKSKKWTSVVVMSLCIALAMPVWTSAQETPTHKHHKYKLIDLGTFGGPASYTLENGAGPGATVLSNRGMLAGWADTSTPDSSALNCSNPDCFVGHTFRWDDGVLTDLGTLPGVNNSAGYGINERGWIAGASQNGAIDPLTGFREGRAILWADGKLIDLGTLGGGYESLGVAVNNRGQVTGFAGNLISDPFFGTQVRAFLWEEGVMRDLGTLGGPDSPPFGNMPINGSGQVAGCSFTNSTPNPVTGVPTADPFLWERGKMTDLGTLGGTIGFPFSLNDRGQVVGQSNLAGDLTYHPFLWDRGVLRNLGTFGGNNGTATWINEGGDVVGVADLPGSQTHDAFLWKHGVMTDLGNLGATSYGYAVNSEEQVVGASRIDAVSGNARAFLWENGGPIVDLNTLIPTNSSLLLAYAVNINDRGEIAGLGVPAGCQPADFLVCGHAYMLIPDGDCDEDCAGRIAASQNNAVPAKNPATINPVNPFRYRLMRGYHLPGQPAAPRN